MAALRGGRVSETTALREAGTARPPKRSFGAAPPHSAGAGKRDGDGLGAAVDGDDDGALRLRVAAEEDVAVARREEPLVRPAPERGVGLADRDELRRSRRGGPRSAGGPCRGGRPSLPTACRCGSRASRRRRGRPPRRSRSSGCRPSSSGGPPRAGRAPRSPPSWKSAARDVVRGEEVREEVARRGPSRATSGSGRRRRVRPRPSTNARAFPWKAKSKPASISSPLEPGVEDLRVAPPDLAEEEEALRRPRRASAAGAPVQKSWATCLTVSRRKPSTPSRFAQAIWASSR